MLGARFFQRGKSGDRRDSGGRPVLPIRFAGEAFAVAPISRCAAERDMPRSVQQVT